MFRITLATWVYTNYGLLVIYLQAIQFFCDYICVFVHTCRWEVLWAGEPTKVTSPQARQFCPPIRRLSFATNLLRLELNSSLLDYYTELDAIVLRGARNHISAVTTPVIASTTTNEDNDAPSNKVTMGNGYFDKLPYEVTIIEIEHRL